MNSRDRVAFAVAIGIFLGGFSAIGLGMYLVAGIGETLIVMGIITSAVAVLAFAGAATHSGDNEG